MAYREARMSNEQRETLITFMENHVDFARGNNNSSVGRKQQKVNWNLLIDLLNKQPGPTKDRGRWQRAWTDIKYRVKVKDSQRRQQPRDTGDGSLLPVAWSEDDERILRMLSDDLIFDLEVDRPLEATCKEQQPLEKEVIDLTHQPLHMIDHEYVTLQPRSDANSDAALSLLADPDSPPRKRKRSSDDEVGFESYVRIGQEAIDTLVAINHTLQQLVQAVNGLTAKLRN